MLHKKKVSIYVLQWGWEILHHLDRAFRVLGHDSRLFQLREPSDVAALIEELKKNPPDLCLTNNLYCFDILPDLGTELNDVVLRKSIPFVSWYWENPASTGTVPRLLKWYTEPPPSHLSFLAVDNDHLDFFRSRGLRAEWLPLGVDSAMENYRPHPNLKSKFQCRVSYSGTPDSFFPSSPPRNEEDLRELYRDSTLDQFISGIESLVEFDPSERVQNLKVIRELFAPHITEFFSSRRVNPYDYKIAYKNLEDRIARPLPEVVQLAIKVLKGRIDFCYSYYLTTSALSLLKPYEPQIYGGESWERWLGLSKPSVRLNEDELKALFASSDISFCLTKTQFSNFFHERIFSVLAAGGLPLTDFRPSLEELFPKGLIPFYSKLEEVPDGIRELLRDSKHRIEIARKAREWAFKCHSYEIRAGRFLEICRERFGILN